MRKWINKQLNTMSKQSRIAWLALIVIIMGNVIGCKKEESTTNTTTSSTTSGTPPTNTITISDLWALGNGTNIGWIRQEKDMNGNWVDFKHVSCYCPKDVEYFTNNKQCVNPTFLDTNLAIYKNVYWGFVMDTLNKSSYPQFWKYKQDTLIEFSGATLNGGCMDSNFVLNKYKITSLSKFIMEYYNVEDPYKRTKRYRKE